MEEELREREWERQRLADARAGMILETQQTRKSKNLLHKMVEENKLLAKEQKAQ